MAFYERAYAWISCAAGSVAFFLASVWFARSWNDGLQIPPPLPEELTDLEALFSLQRAAILFELGVPLLCVPAFLFGLLARQHVAAKIGLPLAAGALVLYLVYLRSCLVLIE